MADNARSFRAGYEHDSADGAWLVRVEGLDGCHTYGRTKPEAAWLDVEPGEFSLTHA